MAAPLHSDGEHNFESGGMSTTDEIPRASASTEAEMERTMISIYKRTVLPMIRRDVNALLQEFLSQIKEEFHLTHSANTTGKSDNTASTSRSQSLQLQFPNGISTPVFTGMKIEGKDHKPFVVALVDGISGQIVNTGDGAAAKIEIVVVKGDCDDEEVESWTLEDFNNKIVSEWKGKKILQGNTYLDLKDGIGFVGQISFKQNSVWTKNNKCRLGARFEDAVFAAKVKEAKTESFLVKDKRSLLYAKHQTPSSSDEVWRLKKISRRGACHVRLRKEGIKTVKDFRALLAINPERLKNILGVAPMIWKVIVNHAQTCKDDRGVYLYGDVAFNVSGQLMGLVSESHYIPSNKLSDDKKGPAQELVAISSQHWKEVVYFDDETSLINDIQSKIALNMSQSARSSLDLLTSQLISDHTSPSTPIVPIGCTNNVHTSGHDDFYATGQSQSTNWSPPEHSMPNTTKKQRVDYFHVAIPPVYSPGIGSKTSIDVTGNLNPLWGFQYQEPNSLNHEPDPSENDDFLQYLDFSQMGLQEAVTSQKWKMVLKVVEWISIVSKKRKRRTTESIVQASDSILLL